MPPRTSVAPAVHRFTRDEYYRMAEAGLFRDERVELLDGEIITMSPQLTLHAFSVNQLMYLLITTLGRRVVIRGQAPIVLNNRSDPEPDIAACVPVPDKYRRAHPKANQVRLVIEVAESSLVYDRTQKSRFYAASGIPEYWMRSRHRGKRYLAVSAVAWIKPFAFAQNRRRRIQDARRGDPGFHPGYASHSSFISYFSPACRKAAR